MKSILVVFISLLGIGYNCAAQNYFNLTSVQTNQVYTGFEAVLEIRMKLQNSTSVLKNYAWERTDVCPLPNGWSGVVCDCHNCYNAQTYNIPMAGSVIDSCTILFTYYFDLGASLGSHTTKLLVTDPNNASAWDEIFLTINNGCPTSLNEQQKVSSFIVNLNNVGNESYLQSLSESNGLRLVVNDMSGRVISKRELGSLSSGEGVYINTPGKGIFLVNIYTSEGQKVGSYKMIRY